LEKVSINKKHNKSILYRFGIGLLILAVLFWIIAAIAPFTPFSIMVKTGIVTGSLIIGEILFWIGAVIVGKEVVTKYKSYLNPKNWRKKRRKQQDDE